jgi:hypothetical protein
MWDNMPPSEVKGILHSPCADSHLPVTTYFELVGQKEYTISHDTLVIIL